MGFWTNKCYACTLFLTCTLLELCLNGTMNQSGLTETMQTQPSGTDGAQCSAFVCATVCGPGRGNSCDLDSGKEQSALGAVLKHIECK